MRAVMRHDFEVVSKKKVNDVMLEVELVKPAGFEFDAGQYMSIKVGDDGTRRSYSIASAPDEANILLAADTTPMGLGSKYLLNTKVGDTISAMAPMGRMVAPLGEGELLFVATGSGIVPFRSIIVDELIYKNSRRAIKLIWGHRYQKDLYWMELWDRLAKEYSNFSFDIILSRPETLWMGKQGHVGDIIPLDLDADVYVCGNQEMVKDLSEKFYQNGLGLNRIHQEKFY